MEHTTIKVGTRGTVVIPSRIRKSYRFEEGALLIAESRPEGLLLRPMVALPIELYTDERKAEFLLNNAVSKEDYAEAVKEVRDMGLSPEDIHHKKPEDL